jgi:hypothetical protein
MLIIFQIPFRSGLVHFVSTYCLYLYLTKYFGQGINYWNYYISFSFLPLLVIFAIYDTDKDRRELYEAMKSRNSLESF